MSRLAATCLWTLPLLCVWLWRPRQASSPSGRVLLVAYGTLGAWAIWFGLYGHAGEPAQVLHWKPTILYWTLAAILWVMPLLGLGYPAKILLGTYFALSNREWRWINRGFALIYTLLGAVNLVVATQASEKDWVGFKYAIMMNLLIIILFRLNFVWLPLLAEVAIHVYQRTTAAYRYLAKLF